MAFIVNPLFQELLKLIMSVTNNTEKKNSR